MLYTPLQSTALIATKHFLKNHCLAHFVLIFLLCLQDQCDILRSCVQLEQSESAASQVSGKPQKMTKSSLVLLRAQPRHSPGLLQHGVSCWGSQPRAQTLPQTLRAPGRCEVLARAARHTAMPSARAPLERESSPVPTGWRQRPEGSRAWNTWQSPGFTYRRSCPISLHPVFAW